MVKMLGNYGSERKYVFSHVGVNSRLDEIQAAVLAVKLPYLDQENARRREHALYYIRCINNPAVSVPTEDYWQENVFHIFPLMSPHRDELMQYLLDNGVQTAIHYPIPPHKQQAYAQWNNMSLPITERIHREELSLPISPTLTDGERQKVVDLINSFVPSRV